MTLGPLMLDVEGHALSAAECDRLRNPLVGGVILFSRNYADPNQLRELVAEIRALRMPPLLIAVDQEGGRIQRFRDGFYALPSLRWLGHQYDLDAAEGRRLAWQCGWLMAAEVLESGVDFSFSPVVDLDYGLSEVIGDRSFHRDPEIVATLAVSWLQGMHKAGMIGVAKHFPGHGHVVADSHLDLPVDHRTLPELYDDLLPYERLLSHGLNAVMVAHVRYPRVDAEVASLSPYWLRTALRRDLGMHGAIFTDDLSMRALASEGEMPERARRALTAGADMTLICNDPVAADATLEALQGYIDPAGQSRLVALRRKAGAPLPGAGLRGSADWRQAVASLDKALARPGACTELMVPPVAGARLVATPAEVEVAYQRLATAIQPELAAGDCVLLGVLLGGVVPLVRVAGLLQGDLLIDVCRVGRYGDATRGGIPQWISPPQVVMRDQHVILIDDIFDEGVTLDFVAAWCRQQGARQLSTAVLVRKRHERVSSSLTPDHVGLEVGDEYVFGCGMDFRGRWRHLDAIWGCPHSRA